MQRFIFPLINTHTHAAMVAFRGLAEDIPLKRWLEQYIWPMEKSKVTPKFIYHNTIKAISEMKENKVRAFCDMYFFEDEVAKAAEREKLHVVIGEVILDFPTPSAKTPYQALDYTENLIREYKNSSYVKVAVAPHSIYAVSKEILIKSKGLANKYNALFHIHLAETKVELDDCLKKYGCTPVEYLEKLDILDEKTILAHCVWVNEKDIKILAKRKVNIAHCPLSNLKLGSGVAPVAKMLDNSINVAIGTDGAASSNRLDIWEAGKFAALLQKGISHNPEVLSTKQVVEMMSVNGMEALGIEQINGKDINYYKRKIERTKKFNYLYELNIENLE